MEHEDECDCLWCTKWDGENGIDPTIVYEDDPSFDEEEIEFIPDPDFFGPEDSDG